MQSNLGSERSSQIIGSLHAILKPFLLRRLKSDVESNLPPKKEYVLYAPLSEQQREAYDRVLSGSLRSYLISTSSLNPTARPEQRQTAVEVTTDDKRRMRSQNDKGKRKVYDFDGDDDEYFEMLENEKLDERGIITEKPDDLYEVATKHQLTATGKFVQQ